MKCPNCRFDMAAEVVDNKVVLYTCPLGHKRVGIIARSHPVQVRSTYPNNLERK